MTTVSERLDAAGAPPEDEQRGISGRVVVIGMFAFGIFMVGLMYAYWELYTRPFRGLQNAIAAEMPGSMPRVIGGRRKPSEARHPETLRIVIFVKFDPSDDAESSVQREAVAGRLAELAAAHQDLSRYEVLEVHLLQLVPEKATRQWTRSGSPEDWGLTGAHGGGVAAEGAAT
ncbi:MAG: hypothetical protein KF774_12285 [Planctomyces sp.]|nr:hypothetical protein [Planctomyces sp.]